MVKMSFYDGTLDTKKAIEIIKENPKPVFYRYGFAYRGAEKREITQERAIEILTKNSEWTDFEEEKDYYLINQYSTNDMW